MEKLEQTGSTDFIDSTAVRVRRDGKLRKIYGKIIVKQQLNNSFVAKGRIFMKTGSGWNLLPYKVDKPVCDFYNDDKFFYPELCKISDFPCPMPCPLPMVS